MDGSGSLAAELEADLRNVRQALGRRARAARSRMAAGEQPGLDDGVDRDLRDAALLRSMVDGLQEALTEVCPGWRADLAARRAPALAVPAALARRLPPAHAEVARLRAQGHSWRSIGASLGLNPRSAIRMAHEAEAVAASLQYIRELRDSGAGEREIALRLGLPGWGVRAATANGPPDAAPPSRGQAGKRGSKPHPARRSSAPYLPPQPGKSYLTHPQVGEAVAPAGNWWLLLTEPGFELSVRSDVVARSCGSVRVMAFVRPGGRLPVVQGLLALDRLCDVEGIPHVRWWVGQPSLERRPWGRRPRQAPTAVPAGTLRRMFQGLGWPGLPNEPVAAAAGPSGRVRITAGPLAGQQGNLREVRSGRARVALDTGLVVEVSPEVLAQEA